MATINEQVEDLRKQIEQLREEVLKACRRAYDQGYAEGHKAGYKEARTGSDCNCGQPSCPHCN